MDTMIDNWVNPPAVGQGILKRNLASIPPQGQVYCFETNSRYALRRVSRQWQDDVPQPPYFNNFIFVSTEPKTRLVGFGTSLTDAAVIQLDKMKRAQVDGLFEWLFGVNHLSLMRIPMGSCDFSLRSYSFLPEEAPKPWPRDTAKWVKQHFRFTEEDESRLRWLALITKRAPALQVLPTPWSAPPWMKTSNSWVGGTLRADCFDLWAHALVEYCVQLELRGLKVAALSLQNEPHELPHPLNQSWETMFFTADELARLVATVQRVPNCPKLLLGDDQRFNMPDLVQPSVNAVMDKERIWGIGLHAYMWPGQGDSEAVKKTVALGHPVLVTEFCTGFSSVLSNPLGRDKGTSHAAQFMVDVMSSLNGGCSGYIDWNLVLDETGGPNWAKNNVDSLVWFDDAGVHVSYMALLAAHIFAFQNEETFVCHWNKPSKGTVPTTVVMADARRVCVTVFNNAWFGKYEFCLEYKGQFLQADVDHRCAKTFVFSI